MKKEKFMYMSIGDYLNSGMPISKIPSKKSRDIAKTIKRDREKVGRKFRNLVFEILGLNKDDMAYISEIQFEWGKSEGWEITIKGKAGSKNKIAKNHYLAISEGNNKRVFYDRANIIMI